MLRILRQLYRPAAELVRLFRRLIRSRKHRRAFVWCGLLLLLVGGIAGELLLEHRHLPWHPLAIDERAGFATSIKLAAIGMGPSAWCEELIAGSNSLVTTSLSPYDGADGCGWSWAVHIEKSAELELASKSPVAMTCPLAAGAHIWLTSIDYRARELLGSGLAAVRHVGSYSCRRMYNRATGPMSEHAYANAWDVTGFELVDGRIVSILKHWDAEGPLGEFLYAVRNDACDIFRVVLGPDYNDAHRDHLHVDMGMALRCS